MEGLEVKPSECTETMGIIRCIVQGRWLTHPSALETLDNLVEGVKMPHLGLTFDLSYS